MYNARMQKTNVCVMSTFDLDMNVLDTMIPQTEDASRYVVFRGDGLFDGYRGSAERAERLLSRVVLCRIPNGFMHAKMILREYSDEGGKLSYSLEITSRNIYHFDNKEISVFFSGEPSKEVEERSQPICRYLKNLCSFLDESDPRRAQVMNLCGRLRKVRLTLTGPYECEDWSIYAAHPDSKETDPIIAMAEDYDELLIMAPNVTGSVLKHFTGVRMRRGECLLVSRREEIDSLLELGPLRLNVCDAEDLCDRYLHAKIYLNRKGRRVDLICGSVNPTHFALHNNIELAVELVNVKGIASVRGFLGSFLGLEEDVIRTKVISGPARCRKILGEADPSVPLFDLVCRMDVRHEYVRHLLDSRKAITPDNRRAAMEYLMSDDCVRALDEIRHHIYDNVPVPEKIVIEQPGGKKREIYIIPFKERCLLGLIGFGLHRYDGLFSPCLYSHRIGVSAEEAFIRMHHSPPENRQAFFKTDIHSYDPSIDEAVLSRKLDSFFADDPDAASFLKWTISSRRYTMKGQVFTDGPAVMSGNPLAGFFENLYLSDMDHYMEKRAGVYLRYADDIIMAARNLDELRKLVSEMRGMLSDVGLTVSEKKTTVTNASGTFDFLSWRVTGRNIDLGLHVVRTWNELLRIHLLPLGRKLRSSGFPEELIIYSCVRKLHAVEKLMGIRRTFRYISCADSLKVMDRMAVDIIRRAVSGHSGKERYCVRYNKIRKMGYRSLVAQYYDYLADKC